MHIEPAVTGVFTGKPLTHSSVVQSLLSSTGVHTVPPVPPAPPMPPVPPVPPVPAVPPIPAAPPIPPVILPVLDDDSAVPPFPPPPALVGICERSTCEKISHPATPPIELANKTNVVTMSRSDETRFHRLMNRYLLIRPEIVPRSVIQHQSTSWTDWRVKAESYLVSRTLVLSAR